jgi:hypothetical protein
MLRHVVMWSFLDSAEGRSKKENLEITRRLLLELTSKIPEVLSVEIGEDIGVGRDPWDMVLIMSFDDADALDRYQNHPEHKQVSAFVGRVRSRRACVDFTIPRLPEPAIL